MHRRHHHRRQCRVFCHVPKHGLQLQPQPQERPRTTIRDQLLRQYKITSRPGPSAVVCSVVWVFVVVVGEHMNMHFPLALSTVAKASTKKAITEAPTSPQAVLTSTTRLGRGTSLSTGISLYGREILWKPKSIKLEKLGNFEPS